MNIACFHLNQIGDLLFSLPALKSLKNWDPEGRLISVARPNCAALLERTGLPDAVFIRRGGSLRAKTELLGKLRAERLDAAVLFSQSVECGIVARLSGAPLRCGITKFGFDRLLTSHITCQRPPSMANDFRVLSLIGCPATCTSYKGLISPLEQDRQQAAELMLREGYDGKSRIIVLAPGTSSRRSIKAWTEHGWADLIEHFGSQKDTSVVLVGSEDVPEILEMASASVINLCRKTSLPVLLGVLEKASLVVGVDSGILHVAAAVGSRVVGIYGMSDPQVTGPHGDGHITISAGIDCSPCQLSVCKKDKICMTKIDSAQVIKAGESVLSNCSIRS